MADYGIWGGECGRGMRGKTIKRRASYYFCQYTKGSGAIFTIMTLFFDSSKLGIDGVCETIGRSFLRIANGYVCFCRCWPINEIAVFEILCWRTCYFLLYYGNIAVDFYNEGGP